MMECDSSSSDYINTGTSQLSSQLVDQQVASSNVSRKVASSTIGLRINGRKTYTTVVVQGGIVVETWMILHSDIVIA